MFHIRPFFPRTATRGFPAPFSRGGNGPGSRMGYTGPMITEAGVLDAILDAAWDSARWPSALEKLCGLLSCSHAMLVVSAADGSEGRLFASRGEAGCWKRVFDEKGPGRMLRLSAAGRRAPGPVGKKNFPSPDDGPPGILPFQGARVHWIGTSLLARTDRAVSLMLGRPARSGPIEKRDIAVLARLIPTLRRALLVNRNRSRAGMKKNIALTALNLIPVGVILLDGRGRLLSLNRRARSILDQGDGLSLGVDGLQAVRPQDRRRLDGLLAPILNPEASPERRAALCPISRTSMNPPYSLLAVPVTPQSDFLWNTAVRGAVFISAPEGSETASGHVLGALYGLTGTEARLAVQLMRGFSVDLSSRRVNISIHSARTYLKRIFAKTGVNRQGDLIRLLLDGPARFLFEA
jgi:DNA-binding CsgD family transcriptional regulator